MIIYFIAQAQVVDPEFKADIAHFTDNLVESQIKNYIAGATVSVVQHGKIIYLKGYGKADVENDIAVVPDKHLFRIGSISKMFIRTAIMQ